MQGYWLSSGEIDPNVDSNLTYHKIGNVFLRSNSKIFSKGDAHFCCEGSLFRFLPSAGINFQANSPIDSLFALYAKEGEDFVKFLDGNFLLFFAPKKDGPIFIVNNRQQATKLYYYQTSERLFFSSSLENLLAISKIDRAPNFGSIRSFLANGFTISEQTQIKGINKMLPADYFVLSADGPKLKSYWKNDIKFNRKEFGNLDAHIDNYEKLYQQSLTRYFESSNPNSIGALLSGGHDTSFLLAQASKLVKKPIKAYTVTFPGWQFNEEALARNVAQKYGAEFYPIPFESNHLDNMLGLIRANEEPVVGSSLPLFVLAQNARNQVDVMLGGDGGDTLWGEYYPVGELHRWIGGLPATLRRGIHSAAKQLRNSFDWERFWELEHVTSLFAEDNYYPNFMRKLCTYRHFNDEAQRSILKPEIYNYHYSKPHLEIEFNKNNFQDALIEGKLFNAFYTYQAYHTTKLMEYNDIELFLPTVDKEVIDFICNLPMKWINGGTTFQRLTNSKKINRKFHKVALSRYFSSSEIYNRSFDIPWFKILRPRKNLLENLRKKLILRGWYNESEIQKLFSEFGSQKIKENELLELKNHGYRIFTLLSLEIWCLEYLDGRFSKDFKNIKLEDYLA